MAASKPFILFITGTSASGKSTLFESLQTDTSLAGVTFHDIDEDGVPVVGRGPWRSYRVEILLYEAVQRFKKGTSTIICGTTLPHEVLTSKYYKLDYNVHFLLLEVSNDLIKKRLNERIDASHAKQHFDESFKPKVRREIISSSYDLKLTLWNTIANLKTGQRIQASTLSVQALTEQAQEYISIISSGKER